jgi:8-oxo-dGTP pyrophosphatase MutT (NUDIX family)
VSETRAPTALAVEPSLERVREALAGSLGAPVDEPPGKAAAVATILRASSRGPEVLFIRRAEREGDPWSGHMAFPGGRREPRDPHLLATALRETIEEIGVDLERHGELVGVLDDEDATGRGSVEPMPIRPYVFQLHAEVSFHFSHEVSEVLWAPLTLLYRDELKSSITVPYRGQSYTLPAWDVEGRIVWGLTYRMMNKLFERVRAR